MWTEVTLLHLYFRPYNSHRLLFCLCMSPLSLSLLCLCRLSVTLWICLPLRPPVLSHTLRDVSSRAERGRMGSGLWGTRPPVIPRSMRLSRHVHPRANTHVYSRSPLALFLEKRRAFCVTWQLRHSSPSWVRRLQWTRSLCLCPESTFTHETRLFREARLRQGTWWKQLCVYALFGFQPESWTLDFIILGTAAQK